MFIVCAIKTIVTYEFHHRRACLCSAGTGRSMRFRWPYRQIFWGRRVSLYESRRKKAETWRGRNRNTNMSYPSLTAIYLDYAVLFWAFIDCKRLLHTPFFLLVRRIFVLKLYRHKFYLLSSWQCTKV